MKTDYNKCTKSCKRLTAAGTCFKQALLDLTMCTIDNQKCEAYDSERKN